MTKYKLFTNFTNPKNPVTIDVKVPSAVVYTGGLIHGITVSELIGALLIADTTNKKITAYIYDPAYLKTQKKTAPYLHDVIKSATKAVDLSGVAVF